MASPTKMLPRRPPESLFGDSPIGWPLGRLGYRHYSQNPFTGLVSSLPDDDLASLAAAVAERRCREEAGFGMPAEATSPYRPHPACPSCGDASTNKDDLSSGGLQRFRCRSCGMRCSLLIGTVLKQSKKDLPAWVDFIRLMTYNVPLDAAAELGRMSHQTAFEWHHRVFATVDGHQDRLMLRDCVWIDETHIFDTDLTRRAGQARELGLSEQQTCIAVAIDVRKSTVAAVCGHGKPSSKRIKDALQAHIAEGSVIVHDKEKAHNALVRDAKCASEAYKADVRNSVHLECVAMVNNLCSWLGRYLWRSTGMDPDNLQIRLNWFVYLFKVRQAEEKWPKTERWFAI